MKTFCRFYAAQFLLYGLLCWSIRSVSQGRILNIAASDLCCAYVSFHLIGDVAAARRNRVAMFGYVFGGASGSVASVSLTKYIWGA